MKQIVKDQGLAKIENSLSIFHYYTVEEIMEAILLNDVEPQVDSIEKIKGTMKILYRLKIAMRELFEKGTDEEIDLAIRTFEKPLL